MKIYSFSIPDIKKIIQLLLTSIFKKTTQALLKNLDVHASNQILNPNNLYVCDYKQILKENCIKTNITDAESEEFKKICLSKPTIKKLITDLNELNKIYQLFDNENAISFYGFLTKCLQSERTADKSCQWVYCNEVTDLMRYSRILIDGLKVPSKNPLGLAAGQLAIKPAIPQKWKLLFETLS